MQLGPWGLSFLKSQGPMSPLDGKQRWMNLKRLDTDNNPKVSIIIQGSQEFQNGAANLLYSNIFHYAFLKPGLKGIYVKINMKMFPTIYSFKVKIKTTFFHTNRKTNSKLSCHYKAYISFIQKKNWGITKYSLFRSSEKCEDFPSCNERITIAKFSRRKEVTIYIFQYYYETLNDKKFTV